MLWYLGRRLIQAVLTVFGVVTFVFVLARLGSDPAALMLPPEASQADLIKLRAGLGLDRSVVVQYVTFLRHAIGGDLGDSIYQRRSASEIVLERVPATLQLAVPSFLIGILIAGGLAILVRRTGSRRLQNALLWVTLGRQAMPDFWFGAFLILIFSVNLGWLPALGRNGIQSLVLPVATLATVQIAVYLRLLNSALSVQYGSDYVRTARATGQGPNRILLRQAAPNAILPTLNLAGLQFGVLLSGTVISETVFSWPGVGRLVVNAVEQGDYPVVQAGVVFVSIIFVAVNLLVDLISAAIDPRVRVAHG